ncbi:squamosa promoter-binding, putative [Babesia ovis]|uniref:Squamosa promoter-binding, putative n=1 Tax=Babesia ovis TaxID=5869 RepID=A0A9W5TDT7_BABOV|nr:squamosa promoter-binding, putative [Babesia ovis]
MARPQYQEIHLKAADVNKYYSAASAPKFEGPVNGEYELVLGEKEGRPVLYDGRQQVILPYVEPEVQRPTCTVQLVNVNPEEPKRCRCLKWILLALAVVAIVSITVHFLRPKIDRPRYRI